MMLEGKEFLSKDILGYLLSILQVASTYIVNIKYPGEQQEQNMLTRNKKTIWQILFSGSHARKGLHKPIYLPEHLFYY